MTDRAVQLLCKIVKGANAIQVCITVEWDVHVTVPRVPIRRVTSSWITCLTPNFVFTCWEGGEFLSEGNHAGIGWSEDCSLVLTLVFVTSYQLIALVKPTLWRKISFFHVTISDHLRRDSNLSPRSFIDSGLLLWQLHCRCSFQGWLHLDW